MPIGGGSAAVPDAVFARVKIGNVGGAAGGPRKLPLGRMALRSGADQQQLEARPPAAGQVGLWTGTASQGQVVYLHGDRLGSPAAKSGSSGVVLERHGFDAWGAGRNGSWQPNANGRLDSQFSPRGFTGHEHLDEVGGLIHMNGRGYDPRLGRFLSVDPIIQFPANSQSLNPYSYLMNNPMSGTDPTGYCSQAIAGSKIRDFSACEVKATAVMSDGSRESLGTFNRLNKNDMARAHSTALPGVGPNGANRAGASAPASGKHDAQGQGSATGEVDVPAIGQFTTPIETHQLSVSFAASTDPRDVARRTGREMLDPFLSRWDPDHPDYHDYDRLSELCGIGQFGCDFDTMEQFVASEAVPFVIEYSGPGAYNLPYGIGTDPIRHFTPALGVWINNTLDGHRYHPGRVGHALFESTGSMWLYTRGVGIGPDPEGNIRNGNWISAPCTVRSFVMCKASMGRGIGDECCCL